LKTLFLLRHAKSSWDDPTLPDHDRPLNKRGIKGAGRIGRLFRDQGIHPQLVLCSTAVRAKETLRLVLEHADFQPTVQYSERLYHCAPSEFPIALQEVSEAIPEVLMIGHNPGLEDFLSQLTCQEVTFPTAALARLELDLAHWSHCNDQTRGRLVEVWRPKELDDA
jgi:phosphohistidine phosphatase